MEPEPFAQYQVKFIDPELYRRFRSQIALDPAKPTINDVFLAFVEDYARRDKPSEDTAGGAE